MLRFNNPEFKIVWRQWFVGVSFCHLSNGRIRFAQAFLGPLQFTVCF